jgi:hypothetical protein
MKSLRNYKTVQVEPGIRIKQNGIEAYFKSNRVQRGKRFPLGTSLEAVRQWRQEQLSIDTDTCFAVPRGEFGYCFIYFLGNESIVKIGRSSNPDVRARDVAAENPERGALKLLGSFLAHSSLEAVIHSAFWHLRLEGEWFRTDDDLQRFIDHALSGANPLTYLWERKVAIGWPKGRKRGPRPGVPASAVRVESRAAG